MLILPDNSVRLKYDCPPGKRGLNYLCGKGRQSVAETPKKRRTIVFRVDGRKLRQLMEERGVGVNELARKLTNEIGVPVTPSGISKLWSDHKRTIEPSFNLIHGIATALGVPVAEFCEGFPPPDAEAQWMAFYASMSDTERALVLEIAKPILKRGRK